ncbi:acyl-CoA dehydrogenase family protein [Pseudonocardia ailaonensis]|uniref:Acyl-CoA dehydrogenase family protein n=1 Tax=Pseudonocardia ailaonensis TaxID=367279 RepID=A0ABN2N4K4_9PSEU
MSGPGEDLDAYRGSLRAWLAANVPRNWRSEWARAETQENIGLQRRWLATLVEAGYAVPHWPAEFGGGATLMEQAVLHQEFARANAPEILAFNVALNQIARTLLDHGTPEQLQHLGGMLRGEVWCQGFSESEAGSDLPALRMRADRDGDSFVLNGHKVWSSYAHLARWGMFLARTDPAAPKRRGLSIFLVDMTSAGVEVRNTRKITGGAEFNEIFLDNVRVSESAVLGGENNGWAVSASTLNSERGTANVGHFERFDVLLQKYTAAVAREGLDSDDVVVEGLGRGLVESEVLRSLGMRTVAEAAAGRPVGPQAAILKLYFGDLIQRVTAEAVATLGRETQVVHEDEVLDSYTSGHWMHDHLNSWTWTIAGGTSQIQRNLIGERALGLPREPEIR